MSNPAPGFKTHPDHTITLSYGTEKIRIAHGGDTVADTTRAILLQENRYPPRYYIPKDDIRMDLLAPTDRSTHCPFKGDASYWSVTAGATSLENAAWAYDAPFDEMLPIKDHICFDTDRFDTVETHT